MYEKNLKSVTSHTLGHIPLSQIVTPSRTPLTLEGKGSVLYGRPLVQSVQIEHNITETMMIQRHVEHYNCNETRNRPIGLIKFNSLSLFNVELQTATT